MIPKRGCPQNKGWRRSPIYVNKDTWRLAVDERAQEILARPVADRPGKLKTLKDMTDIEIQALEKELGYTIIQKKKKIMRNNRGLSSCLSRAFLRELLTTANRGWNSEEIRRTKLWASENKIKKQQKKLQDEPIWSPI